MKKSNYWIIVFGVLTCFLVLLVAIFALRFRTIAQQLQAKRAFAPPVVQISTPEMGDSFPAGSTTGVVATVLDRQAITKVELWMDGTVVDQINPVPEESTPPLYANFDLLIPGEGAHTLFVRAVNTAGVIGDSLQVEVVGVEKPAQTYIAVEVEEGQTLEDIASEEQTSAEEIINANPGLAGGPPQTGTTLMVPNPPANQPAGQINPPANQPPGQINPPANQPTEQMKPPPAGPANQAPMVPNIPMLQLITGTFTFPPLVPIVGNMPPAAPTDLQAKVENCMVTLVWNDNADNETQYDVYMNGDGVYYNKLIATLNSSNSKGKAWYQLPAPAPGRLTFWVEAVNNIGKAPSNIVYADVDGQCPDNLAAQLEIEAVNFNITDQIDRYYCYVSFQGKPAVRIPADKNTFIDAKSGSGKIADYAAGKNKLVVPLPESKQLLIMARCLGWGSDSLYDIGGFYQGFPETSWDGQDQKVAVGSNELTIRIRPLQGQVTPGTFGFDDPTLPAPYNLREKRLGDDASTDPLDEYEWFWKRMLLWDWSGDPAAISGFTIYLNGKPYATVQGAGQRSVEVTLPATCDYHLRWQVAANGIKAESTQSAPLEYDLPYCTTRLEVEVTFEELYPHYTTDDDLPQSYCQTLETYARLYVATQSRQFWGGNFFKPVKCHTVSLYEYTDFYKPLYKDGKPNVIKVEVPILKEPGLNAPRPISVTVGARMWDHDDSSGDDLVASFQETFWFPDYESIPGPEYYGMGKVMHLYTGSQTTTEAEDSHWRYTIWFRKVD